MPRLCRLPHVRPFHAPGPSARLPHQMPGQRRRPVTAPTNSTWLSNRSSGIPSTCGHPLLRLLSTARRVARCSERGRRPHRTSPRLRAPALLCARSGPNEPFGASLRRPSWCTLSPALTKHCTDRQPDATRRSCPRKAPQMNKSITKILLLACCYQEARRARAAGFFL